MKKFMTFDSIAYAMSLMIFLFVAVMLCNSCMKLQQHVNQKQEMDKDVRAMFTQLDKSL
jgi:hypothetical protein